MERVLISEISQKTGQKLVLKGWASVIRDLGKVVFIVLRDASGEVQVVVKSDNSQFEEVKKLSREDVLEITGIPVKNEKAMGGVEVTLNEFSLLSKAEPLPIEFSGKIETDLSKRLDYRYLDLRNRKNKKIFEIKTSIIDFAREFLRERKFIEVHTPKIVAQGAEGGSEMFPILYYDKEGYLTQSPQFYKQFMQSAGFERVFEIGPTYRAEKSHTTRHLSEYWGLDVCMSFIESYEEVMELLEEMICYVVDKLKENCSEDFEFLGAELPVYTRPFPRVTIKEGFEMIGKSEGKDFTPEEEKLFGEKAKEKFGSDFVFVTKYPFEKRPFYTKKDEENPELTDSFDLVFRGVELVTGGQREHRFGELLRQTVEKGMNPESVKFYLESFKYGTPPHGGFGLGLERFVMQLLDLGNVREAVLFPRDVERLLP